MNKLQIIGLAGTNGSGKDTVGQVLADDYNYFFVSVTEILRAELKRRGLPADRENLRALSADWRRETGKPGILVDKAIEEYQKVADKFSGVAIASLRHPGEADCVHQLGGTVIWIDADPGIRYQRIQANATSRGRPEEDNRTYEQFLTDEAAEMTQSGDAATLSLSAVRARADLFLTNDTDDLATFRDYVKEKLDVLN